MRKKWIIGISIIAVLIVLIVIVFVIHKHMANKIVPDTLPYLLQENCEILESDIEKGMTIKDSYGNEWVWISVPKSEVFLTAKNIEKDILEYTKAYAEEKYTDNIEEYKDLKKKTLKSIYTYGGFWISRYEIGNSEIREAGQDINAEPVSKQDKYVYNYVDFEQAKELADKISNSEYESNLMFGFQWDLVCKFIEKHGYMKNGRKITERMISSNSSTWGNYYTSMFNINRGEYSLDYGKTYVKVEQEIVKKGYKYYLLTTGASEQNKICNIYDFAGNATEWTLQEIEISGRKWQTLRDGNFYFNYGGNDPVSGHYMVSNTSNKASYGFRVACVK